MVNSQVAGYQNILRFSEVIPETDRCSAFLTLDINGSSGNIEF